MLGALAFTAIGVAFVRSGQHVLVGWASTVFWGFASASLLFQLLDRRPRLVIDDQGVFDRTLGVGVIPWSEIRGASVASAQGQPFVRLELRDAALFTRQLATWRRRLSRANRLFGIAELNLNLATLPVRAEEVVAEIERQRAARRGS